MFLAPLLLVSLLAPLCVQGDVALQSALQYVMNDFVSLWDQGDPQLIQDAFFSKNASILVPGAPAFTGANISLFLANAVSTVTIFSFFVTEADWLHRSSGVELSFVYCLGNMTSSSQGQHHVDDFLMVWSMPPEAGASWLIQDSASVTRPNSTSAFAGSASTNSSSSQSAPAVLQAAPLAPVGDNSVLALVSAVDAQIVKSLNSGNSTNAASYYDTEFRGLSEEGLLLGRDAVKAVFDSLISAGYNNMASTVFEAGDVVADPIYFSRSAYVLKNSTGAVIDVGKTLALWRADAVVGPLAVLALSSSDLH